MVIRDLMAIKGSANRRVLLHLLKDFSNVHIITSLAKELNLSRVGVWKILKKLKDDKYVIITSIGKGKTNASVISLNWENSLVEKLLSFYLAEEAVKQRRWQFNFAELENEVYFGVLYGSILHSPREAGDIDILGITLKKNFVKIQAVIDKVQKTQAKKIHAINFTESEFRIELQKPNPAFVDAIKKGKILFGQDNFVKFMKEMV